MVLENERFSKLEGSKYINANGSVVFGLLLKLIIFQVFVTFVFQTFHKLQFTLQFCYFLPLLLFCLSFITVSVNIGLFTPRNLITSKSWLFHNFFLTSYLFFLLLLHNLFFQKEAKKVSFQMMYSPRKIKSSFDDFFPTLIYF
jgi:hypothetical protein